MSIYWYYMINDMNIIKNIKQPEITTSMMMGLFSNYSDPRKKIHSLVKSGFLQAIKQGVFLVSEDLGLRPYSKEVLANLIYGPSYISLETALSHYGFIPEKVTTTTSVCFGRNKYFTTPVGDFKYSHVKDSIYSHGVQQHEIFENIFCQYASPEKALLDFIYLREFKGQFRKSQPYFEYIVNSFRLDLEAVGKIISLKKINDLAQFYPHQHIQWFASELTRNLLK